MVESQKGLIPASFLHAFHFLLLLALQPVFDCMRFGFLLLRSQALSGRRERVRRVVVGGTNARPSPPVAQATAQGANTSRAAAWRMRAALTPTAGV